MQKLLPLLAGAPPGQMRGPREGVYPLRYSTDRGTKQMARCRPAPQGWGALARWSRRRGIAPQSQRSRLCSFVAPRQRAKSPPAKSELIFAQTLSSTPQSHWVEAYARPRERPWIETLIAIDQGLSKLGLPRRCARFEAGREGAPAFGVRALQRRFSVPGSCVECSRVALTFSD